MQTRWGILFAVLTPLFGVTLAEVRHDGDAGVCPSLNSIYDGTRVYFHAQTESDHRGEFHFRATSTDCAKSPIGTTSGFCQHEQGTPGLVDPTNSNRASSQYDTVHAETQCGEPRASATFVTALYDIGRGDWTIFPRPYSIYLDYFRDVLKLNVNMIVVVDDSDREFIWEARREANLTNSTRVWARSFTDLPLYRHLSGVKEVLLSDGFRQGHANLRHPEAFSAEYIILMNSKLSLLQDAVEANPFCSSHFVWIDAGYGHGKGVLPPEGVEWIPRGLIDIQEKVTIIQLERPLLYEHYKYSDLFKLGARPAFIGGFFGGDGTAISLLTALHTEVFEDFLEKQLVHEDQMMMLMCYFRRPDYFNPVPGWWYDGYKLFH